MAPRGTKDILPSNAALWNSIEEKARKIFKLYGYGEIRTPIFEQKELFCRSLGEGSDIIQKQPLNLATTTDKGFCLRPEATASIVRAYIEHGISKKSKFIKFSYIGPMFRGERPQKGRLRQFHHIGAEAIGVKNPLLDVEIITLAVKLLTDFGIKGYVLKINNLGCFKDREKLVKVLRKALKNRIGDLCDNCQERFKGNVLRVFDCKNDACRAVIEELKIGDEHLCSECQAYFREVIDGLDALKISHTVFPYLVRGLDYYTRTVFEIAHADLGSQDAIGAGGRYDSLVKDLGGPDLGAVGFALGVERLILAAQKEESSLISPTDVYVVHIGKNIQKQGFQIVNLIRDSGISCDMYYDEGSLKSQMRSADKIDAKFVVLLGEDEVKKNTVTLKNMSSGVQDEIRQDKIVEVLKDRL